MKDFKTLVQIRRSHRQFTDEKVSAEDVRLILRAALMSPTSMNQRAWQFAVTDDPEAISRMAEAKESGGLFLKDAPLAIVIMGDPKTNGCWIEDGAIAATIMQLQAEDLGLGSCWIQMRDKYQKDGTPANKVIHDILGLPEEQEVLFVLAIGHSADVRKPQNEERLKWENVINKTGMTLQTTPTPPLHD